MSIEFDAHIVFASFLDVIGYDASVLLDFLISDETSFLTYLMQYVDEELFCLVDPD
jgi:hypothetical protein